MRPGKVSTVGAVYMEVCRCLLFTCIQCSTEDISALDFRCAFPLQVLDDFLVLICFNGYYHRGKQPLSICLIPAFQFVHYEGPF